MRTLHIIMPMAGEGSRFLKEGWTTPKPLIMLNGIPLFKHAINSVLSEDIPMKYSFIVVSHISVERLNHQRWKIEERFKFYKNTMNTHSQWQYLRSYRKSCMYSFQTKKCYS